MTEPQGHAQKQPRRVPAIITYLHPFRIIEADGFEPWSVTIEQVNGLGWDYIKLHELVGGLDVGLPQPYHMVVGRDGALALPPIPELLAHQQAVEFFNRCLAGLLLGGVYCEAIQLDNLDLGHVIDWKFIRSTQSGQAGPNRFHDLIRKQKASAYEAIALMEPKRVHFRVLADAMGAGSLLLRDVPQLSPEFLLKGVSGLARRDWGMALTNLWITTEQITECLWDRHVLRLLPTEARIPGRQDQLKDTRTWTAANRHELLALKGIYSEADLGHLYVARKARNDLAHRGQHPTEQAATSAYEGVLALLRCAVGSKPIPLAELKIGDHRLSDPFSPIELKFEGAKFWMDFPKLPGEAEIEQEEATARKLAQASDPPGHIA